MIAVDLTPFPVAPGLPGAPVAPVIQIGDVSLVVPSTKVNLIFIQMYFPDASLGLVVLHDPPVCVVLDVDW